MVARWHQGALWRIRQEIEALDIDDCKMNLNYLGSEKKRGNEPWGEDLFAQCCMDLHGIDKVDAFDITTDVGCAA